MEHESHPKPHSLKAGCPMSDRYRVTSSTLYILLLAAGLRFFVDPDAEAISVAAICGAAAGLSFAAAELTEGVVVLGQALKNILDARREKRDRALIAQGRREARVELVRRIRSDSRFRENLLKEIRDADSPESEA